MTGGGLAGWAAFAGNTQLVGAYAFGTLSLGSAGGGGLLQLGAGTSVSSSSATLASGSLLAGHGSALTVSGTLSLGTQGVAGASLTSTGGSDADVLALVLNNAADSIYVDPTSIVEVGGAGTGSGRPADHRRRRYPVRPRRRQPLRRRRQCRHAVRRRRHAVGRRAERHGHPADRPGRHAGAGTGCAAPAQTVAFAGQGATLALNEEAWAPAGTLTGFATGDAIDVRGSAISSATYAATGSGIGVLTLFYGAQVAAQLTLAGSYAGRAFPDLGRWCRRHAGHGGGARRRRGQWRRHAQPWHAYAGPVRLDRARVGQLEPGCQLAGCDKRGVTRRGGARCPRPGIGHRKPGKFFRHHRPGQCRHLVAAGGSGPIRRLPDRHSHDRPGRWHRFHVRHARRAAGKRCRHKRLPRGRRRDFGGRQQHRALGSRHAGAGRQRICWGPACPPRRSA